MMKMINKVEKGDVKIKGIEINDVKKIKSDLEKSFKLTAISNQFYLSTSDNTHHITENSLFMDRNPSTHEIKSRLLSEYDRIANELQKQGKEI